jgi:hypothetical protein
MLSTKNLHSVFTFSWIRALFFVPISLIVPVVVEESRRKRYGSYVYGQDNPASGTMTVLRVVISFGPGHGSDSMQPVLWFLPICGL